MSADRLRQAVLRAEEIDGARFGVVVAEDGRLLLLFRRERLIDARRRRDHLRPAESPRVVMRQNRATMRALARLDFERQRLDVARRRVAREYGKRERQR